MNAQFEKILNDLNNRLHEPGLFTNFLSKIEAKTNVKRLHLVLGKILNFTLFYISNNKLCLY